MNNRYFSRTAASAALLAMTAGASFALEPPAPGVSARVDAIREAGVLKVAVINLLPWLAENTTGSGDPWSGPAWMLAQKYADELGVELQAIPVSNETKVPVLASNQVDISIAPLAETEARLKVIDYVLYSSTSVCMFGLKSNPKFAEAKSIDDLNNPDITVAYLLGASEEAWIKERLPNANLRGVITSSDVPIDEVMAKRADAAPINRVAWPALQKKVPQLIALPTENNCQDSQEKAQPVGLAIAKGQPEFLQYLRDSAAEVKDETTAAEQQIIANQMK